jgi:hypothetical protein
MTSLEIDLFRNRGSNDVDIGYSTLAHWFDRFSAFFFAGYIVWRCLVFFLNHWVYFIDQKWLKMVTKRAAFADGVMRV